MDNNTKTELIVNKERHGDRTQDDGESSYKQPNLHDAGGFVIPDKPSIYVVVGSPGSGKTHLVKDLMFKYMQAGYFRYGLTVCPTAFTGSYKWVPEHSILPSFDMDAIQAHVDKMRAYAKTGGKIPPNYLLLDDAQGTVKWDERMSNLIATYRHTNTTIIFIVQYLQAGSSTTLRECASYFFVFNSKFNRTLVGLYEAIGQLFNNYNEFLAMFRRTVRKKHDCLLYVNREAYTLEDSYWYYRANEEIPDFEIVF